MHCKIILIAVHGNFAQKITGMLILGLGLKTKFLGLGFGTVRPWPWPLACGLSFECSGLGIKYKAVHYCLKYGM